MRQLRLERARLGQSRNLGNSASAGGGDGGGGGGSRSGGKGAGGVSGLSSVTADGDVAERKAGWDVSDQVCQDLLIF